MGELKSSPDIAPETDVICNSVIDEETSAPAFIGYTEKAVDGDTSLLYSPTKIFSISEFITLFGGAPFPQFSITEISNSKYTSYTKVESEKSDVLKESFSEYKDNLTTPIFIQGESRYVIIHDSGTYNLFKNLLMFFNNGGESCYIVSVGNYSDVIRTSELVKGIEVLENQNDLTLVVVPESIVVNQVENKKIHLAQLAHCAKFGNHLTILDIWEGYKELDNSDENRVSDFRRNVGVDYLEFGDAYYPWLNSSLLSENDVGLKNIITKDLLQKILKSDLLESSKGLSDSKKIEYNLLILEIERSDLSERRIAQLNNFFFIHSFSFRIIIKSMLEVLNMVSPSAAIAGIYTHIDKINGSRKLPLNIELQSVITPTINITNSEQEDLNIPINGKCVNAIRSFIGERVQVLGVESLDTNSDDDKYIIVRRTLAMIQRSLALIIKAYTFEPSSGNTLVPIKNSITNFLINLWRKGRILGSTPDEAFIIKIRLRKSVSKNNTQDLMFELVVLVAIRRENEYVEIKYNKSLKKINK